MKFPSGVSVLLYWYDYGEAVRDYSIPAVFISEDNEGKAPFLAPENFDFPDWWYTWIDCDNIIRKLTKQDWALILVYFKRIYQAPTGTFYRWEAKERFKDMCQRIYSLLDTDEYKPNQWGYRKFERVLVRIQGRIERGEIDVAGIDPHKFYTVKEVADILRYHIDSIRQLLQSGRLKGSKPGGMDWRIPGQSILDLMGMDPKGVDNDG
jgi:excisionase family DNA binding protein